MGLGSGTDALFLSLKALGIKAGAEVITTPLTFYATIGAIVTSGATPVFSDMSDDFNIKPEEIEVKITSRTIAILPVHWSGLICDMNEISSIASKHNLYIVEDACHAIQATYKGRHAGLFGDVGCFSMHPLKNLNVWGHGGFLITNSRELYEKIYLMRNHGLRNRDTTDIFSYNSRLDTIQAIVANHLIEKLDFITQGRTQNALFYDQELDSLDELTIPKRHPEKKQVFHIYSILAKERDGLKEYLIKNGVDAKVHYPVPMHLQPAAKTLGYKKGDFPVAEKTAVSTLSLPVHEHLTRNEQKKVVALIKDFYSQ